MSLPNYLKYKVSSKLPKLLGRESVSTDVQALFELVKNSYDADASQVKITFKNIELLNESTKKLNERYKKLITELKIEKPDIPISTLDEIAKNDPYYSKQEKLVKECAERTAIIVEDSGNGMSLDQLENKWMKIGVSKESKEIVTKKKRRVVGEKGVGRFAVERLSKKTMLTSKTKGSKIAFIVNTDWEEFEKSSKNVTDIHIPLTHTSKPENEQGLKIELHNLRDKWTSSKIEKFIEELELLVLPSEIDPKFPFSIKLKYEKNGKYKEIEVEGGLLKKAPYHFVAELTPESTIRFVTLLHKKEKIIPNVRGVKYEKLKEEFPFIRPNEKESSVASCGPATLTFYGFPFDPTGKKFGWEEFYGSDRVAQIREDVVQNSGIKIYRDGFRVRPYGEPNNDWLSLESKARSTAGKLGKSYGIGWVSISTEKNPGIVDTTTREQIIENEAFTDLIIFVQRTLHEYYQFTEKQRQAKVKQHETSLVPKFVKKLRVQVIDNASIKALDKKNILDALDQIQSHFRVEEERVSIEKEALMDETDAYRNLASLGITTGVVAHEVRDYLRSILSHSDVLKKETGKKEINRERIEKSIGYIEPSVKNLQNYMLMVSAFTSAMSTRKKEFRKKIDLNLYKEFDFIQKTLYGIFKRWDIDVDNNIPENFPKLRMFKADLQSILLNFISNSIKSLKLLTEDRKSKPESQKNRIRITANVTKDNITIIFSDNGIGIPLIDREYAFDLFWTRTATQESVKTGSGLGLPIIKSTVQDYNGVITIEANSEFKTGVTFKMVIPKDKIIKDG